MTLSKKFSLAVDGLMALVFVISVVEYWVWGLPYSESWGNMVSVVLTILLIDRIARRYHEAE